MQGNFNFDADSEQAGGSKLQGTASSIVLVWNGGSNECAFIVAVWCYRLAPSFVGTHIHHEDATHVMIVSGRSHLGSKNRVYG